MNKAVLDTDTLSAIMRQEATVLTQARAYLSSYSQLSVSIITQFEILRGLNAKKRDLTVGSFQYNVSIYGSASDNRCSRRTCRWHLRQATSDGPTDWRRRHIDRCNMFGQ
jgi:predicted nucleic acid-binding protein